MGAILSCNLDDASLGLDGPFRSASGQPERLFDSAVCAAAAGIVVNDVTDVTGWPRASVVSDDVTG